MPFIRTSSFITNPEEMKKEEKIGKKKKNESQLTYAAEGF